MGRIILQRNICIVNIDKQYVDSQTLGGPIELLLLSEFLNLIHDLH